LIFFGLFFFLVWNFFYLFIFFELTSLPIIFITLVFGVQVEKIRAIYIYVFFSFITGLPFIFYLFFYLNFFIYSGPVFFVLLVDFYFFLFLTLIFLIKFPIFLLHFWLPKVHVEANTLASMLLAGLLLKLGVFGFIRFFILIKVLD